MGLLCFMINETLLGFCILYIVSDHGSGCSHGGQSVSTDFLVFLCYHVGAAMEVG